VGDLLVLHDTRAYGASMSSNFNSTPLAAEVVFERGMRTTGASTADVAPTDRTRA
jgi:hypothetical protein